jgi:hypothetical protein
VQVSPAARAAEAREQPPRRPAQLLDGLAPCDVQRAIHGARRHLHHMGDFRRVVAVQTAEHPRTRAARDPCPLAGVRDDTYQVVVHAQAIAGLGLVHHGGQEIDVDAVGDQRVAASVAAQPREVHVAQHRVQVAVQVVDPFELWPQQQKPHEHVVQQVSRFRVVTAREVERRPPQHGVLLGNDVFVTNLAARQFQQKYNPCP